MRTIASIAVLFAITSSSPSNAADLPSASAERTTAEAIQRALPYLERDGVKWMDERGCVSCHQVPFMVWSLNAAARRGFDGDSEKLAEWNAWSTDWKNFVAPKGRDDAEEGTVADQNTDTMTFLLLATRYDADQEVAAAEDGASCPDRNPVDEQQAAEWSDRFAGHLIQFQQADGSWKPRGQLPAQKRPLRETEEVMTMWTLLALSSQDQTADGFADAEKRAMAWLGDSTQPKSTEWLAVRLLLDHRSGRTPDVAASRTALLNAQQADGGWGFLVDDASDAFGTGVALYALRRTGAAIDDQPVQKAVAFLVNSQQEDGSWKVNGTKKNAANRATPTASFWGSAWAVIGLLETLPENG